MFSGLLKLTEIGITLQKALQNRLFAQALSYRDFKILTYAQYAAVLKSLWP